VAELTYARQPGVLKPGESNTRYAADICNAAEIKEWL